MTNLATIVIIAARIEDDKYPGSMQRLFHMTQTRSISIQDRDFSELSTNEKRLNEESNSYNKYGGLRRIHDIKKEIYRVSCQKIIQKIKHEQ